MTYSAEFIVNVGQFEHVKFIVTASSDRELHDRMSAMAGGNTPVMAGDTHAAIKAAVLYGRDQAIKALNEPATSTEASETHKLSEADRRGIVSMLGGDPDAASNLIIQELDAKVLDVQDKSQKPWERPVEAAPVKPWEVVAEQSAKPADDPFADF